MIITTKKPEEEVRDMLKKFKKIFIIGCGTCATTCQTGGEEQVKEWVSKLEDKEVTGSVVVESPCDTRILKRDTRPFKKEIEEADAILCLGCGAGTQNVGEYFDKIVIPGLNTKFLGKIERIGRFYERCRACGDCVLFETGGICPIVRCAKGLLNGPCGGMFDGKCEAGGYERDCAWVLIYDRLKKWGMLENFKKFRPPRDNSKLQASPREVVWR